MDKNITQIPLKAGRLMKLSQEQRKMILSGSLASVLLMAIFINETVQSWTLSAKENISGRGIASASDDSEYLRDVEWEHSLAKRLAKPVASESAQVQTLASSMAYEADLDKLAFVDLEGKYSLRLENGKVKEIEFSKSGAEQDRPKHVNAEKFLGQYKNLWSVSFQTVSVESQQAVLLKDAQQNPVGRARLSIDDRGRLIGLKFENL